jgi:hypothetical protein
VKVFVTGLLLGLRVLAGLVWSGALVLIALACFERYPQWIGPELARAAGVCCLAAGEFVLMAMVLDGLFPRANPSVTWTLKWTAGLVFWGSAGLCVYLVGSA